MKKPTILAIDDTIENLDLLKEMLEEYDVIDTTNGKDGIALAKQQKIDLILLDIIMPDINGYEVCKILKNSEKTRHIPIIFLTGQHNEQSIEKAYDLGASDYVTKPFLPGELLARVKKELRIQNLIEKLEKQASKDILTNLYNRRFFYESSAKAIEYAKRNSRLLSIIILDIDHFKHVNDTYGHAAGDDVLKALASTMQHLQRKSDIIARIGGEEFTVLLPDTSREQAIEIAQRLRETIEKVQVQLKDGSFLQFTVSLGASSIRTDRENDIEPALLRADRALYRAKKSGRNNVQSE